MRLKLKCLGVFLRSSGRGGGCNLFCSHLLVHSDNSKLRETFKGVQVRTLGKLKKYMN